MWLPRSFAYLASTSLNGFFPPQSTQRTRSKIGAGPHLSKQKTTALQGNEWAEILPSTRQAVLSNPALSSFRCGSSRSPSAGAARPADQLERMTTHANPEDPKQQNREGLKNLAEQLRAWITAHSVKPPRSRCALRLRNPFAESGNDSDFAAAEREGGKDRHGKAVNADIEECVPRDDGGLTEGILDRQQ